MRQIVLKMILFVNKGGTAYITPFTDKKRILSVKGVSYIIGNCEAISYDIKPSGGCARMYKEDVTKVTTFGATKQPSPSRMRD